MKGTGSTVDVDERRPSTEYRIGLKTTKNQNHKILEIMKTNQKVNLGFTHYSDENVLVIAQTVLAAMTDNSHFTDPYPALSEVELVMTDYAEKLSEARKRGSPYDTATKNEARKKLEASLAELAFYVNKVAEGNLVTMLSSGFPVSRYRNSVLSPEIVRNLIVTDGRHKGEMVFSFDKLPSILFYEYRYSSEKDEHGEVNWGEELILTTKSRNNLIKPVIPGETYYLSVRATNSKGAGDWSDPISWMAR